MPLFYSSLTLMWTSIYIKFWLGFAELELMGDSFHLFGKILSFHHLKYSFTLLSLLFLSVALIKLVFDLYILSIYLWCYFLYFTLFLLYGNFLWVVLQFINWSVARNASGLLVVLSPNMNLGIKLLLLKFFYYFQSKKI